jgi:hypothetical protein
VIKILKNVENGIWITDPQRTDPEYLNDKRMRDTIIQSKPWIAE